jgi:hypothetical protein
MKTDGKILEIRWWQRILLFFRRGSWYADPDSGMAYYMKMWGDNLYVMKERNIYAP